MEPQKNFNFNRNKMASFAALGPSNHSREEREENDFYATAPLAVEQLLAKERFSKKIWEPAAGMKHIANVLEKHGHEVYCTDILARVPGITIQDFMTCNEPWDGDIITNPPYKMGEDFVEHSMQLISNGHKVAMFLKLTFLETQKRRELFRRYPPKVVYVASNRLGCAKGGDFKGKNNVSSAVCYCWFIWEKGFKGDPIIRWFNDGSDAQSQGLF